MDTFFFYKNEHKTSDTYLNIYRSKKNNIYIKKKTESPEYKMSRLRGGGRRQNRRRKKILIAKRKDEDVEIK